MSISSYSQNNIDSIRYFNDRNAVYLKKEEHVLIKLVNNKPEIESNTELEKIILTENINFLADENIYHDSFIELLDVNAELLIPLGKKYKSVPVSNIQVKDNFSSNSFYDDGKVSQIIFPHSPKNSIVKLSYKEKYLLPELLGRFFFSSYFPVIKSSFSISFPEQVKIKFLLMNSSNYSIKFTESKKKDIITYTWNCNMVEEYSHQDDGFSVLYFEPHIIMCIESINNINFLSSYKDLYKRTIQMIGNPYNYDIDELKPIVDSLCSNSQTEIEKLEAIYYYVQEKIQYLAIEDGLSGIVPDKPINVLKKHYGDCKGKANLLTALLRQADINANLTWVGTRTIPYKYTEIHSPFIDNHMIVTAIIDGKYYSLDPTSSFLHYAYPSSFTQGKESLVGFDSSNCEIYEIPIVKYTDNYFKNELVIKIQNDSIVCSGKVSMTGYNKMNFTEIFNKYNEKKHSDIYKSFLDKNYEKAIIDTAYSENLNNRSDTLFIYYDFILQGYIKRYNDNLYINMNLDKKYYKYLIDTSVYEYHKYFEFAHYDQNENTFIIPDGYEIESIPANCSLKYNNFGFEMHYTSTQGKIIMTEYFYLKNPYVDINDFNEWNSMIQSIIKAYGQTISLKKKNYGKI